MLPLIHEVKKSSPSAILIGYTNGEKGWFTIPEQTTVIFSGQKRAICVRSAKKKLNIEIKGVTCMSLRF